MKNVYKDMLLQMALLMVVSFQLTGQIFQADGGYFVSFHPAPDKEARVRFVSPSFLPNTSYGWPGQAGTFIRQYREASMRFTTAPALSDDDLMKAWNSLELQSVFAEVGQYHPVMLMALGQATWIEGTSSLTSCDIQIEWREKQEKKTLYAEQPWLQPIEDVHINRLSPDDIRIHLKVALPGRYRIDSLQVFRRAIGAPDSIPIRPLVLASSLARHTEIHIRDTMKVIGEFIYTLIPVDVFGHAYPALPPFVTSNYTSHSRPLIRDFRTSLAGQGKSIRLSWSADVPERIRGIEIFRSYDTDGPFQKIASLPATDSVYVDHVEGVMRHYYYYVQVLDQTGTGYQSIVQFITPTRQEKPMAPFDPLALSVPGGIRVQWTHSDPLTLIRGYYVFRKNEDDTWNQVSAFLPASGPQLSFTDSSSTLRPETEYAFSVKAESTSYIQSERSEMTWARPGKSRKVPVPSGIGWRNMEGDSVMIYWADPVAQDPFIIWYHIYECTSDGQVLQEVPGSPVESSKGAWYGQTTGASYILQAEDAWGNRSLFTGVLKAKSMQRTLRPGPILAKPTPDGYRLMWQPPAEGTITQIRLYEIVGDGSHRLVTSLSPAKKEYIIRDVKAETTRSYFLRYTFIDQSESASGDIITLRS